MIYLCFYNDIIYLVEHSTKRGTPLPQNIEKQKGGHSFRRRRRPCSPANRLQIKICSVWRAPWTPSKHPEFFFFFSRMYSGWTEWSKVGCDQVTLFGMLTRGYTPPSLLSLGNPRFWCDFPPFWHVADWCAPDWLKNTARGRLFQLVVVVARRKDYVPRRNDQRSRPAQTWSAYVITNQHTPELGSVITAYHDETWFQVVSDSHLSRVLEQSRRFQIPQTHTMRTTSVTRVALPISSVRYPSSSTLLSTAIPGTQILIPNFTRYNYF